jgi:hypothetical protein
MLTWRSFADGLVAVAFIEMDLPIIQVVRDQTDDMILACALAANRGLPHFA